MKKVNILEDFELDLEVIAKLSEEELQQLEGGTDDILETTSFCTNPPFSYSR